MTFAELCMCARPLLAGTNLGRPVCRHCGYFIDLAARDAERERIRLVRAEIAKYRARHATERLAS